MAHVATDVPIDVQQECIKLLLYAGLRGDSDLADFLGSDQNKIVRGFQGVAPIMIKGGEVDYEDGRLPMLGVYPDEKVEVGKIETMGIAHGYVRTMYAMWAITLPGPSDNRKPEEKGAALCNIVGCKIDEIIRAGATVTTPWGDIAFNSYLVDAIVTQWDVVVFEEIGMAAVEASIEIMHLHPMYKTSDGDVTLELVKIIARTEIEGGQNFEMEAWIDVDPS
jgi:hypothetical protein